MQLDLVITQLRAFAPSLAQRVGGAAQFDMLPEKQALTVPCAYVIPLEDNPEPSKSMTSVRQEMTESFAVIVALSNTPDERGQNASISLHTVRAELWKALLGWRPVANYGHTVYEGGSLLQLDRARMWYRFEFGVPMEIGPEDGWEQGMLAALPKLKEVRVNVDVIDPIAQPSPGPDGRIEFQVRVANLNP